MGPSTSLILISAVLLLSTTAASAFNITRMLERSGGDYGEFNSLLSRTGLSEKINKHSTITVLAIKNGNLGSINGKSEDVLKRILSNHVVLDYFDTAKLSKITDKIEVTTLHQESGSAEWGQGFLNIERKDGEVYFGSATKGSPHDSKLEGGVIAQPYNISVLSISQPIIANGIDGVMRPAAAPSPKSDKSAESPSPLSDNTVPPASESPVETEAPTSSETASEAPTPTAGAPDADAPPADAEAPSAAAGKGLISGVSVGLVMAVAFLLAH